MREDIHALSWSFSSDFIHAVNPDFIDFCGQPFPTLQEDLGNSEVLGVTGLALVLIHRVYVFDAAVVFFVRSIRGLHSVHRPLPRPFFDDEEDDENDDAQKIVADSETVHPRMKHSWQMVASNISNTLRGLEQLQPFCVCRWQRERGMQSRQPDGSRFSRCIM